MRIQVLVIFVVMGVAIIGAWSLRRDQRGAVIAAIGWLVNDPSCADYSRSASEELRQVLASRGFKVTARPRAWFAGAGIHTATETDEWYVGDAGGSLPFYVRLQLAGGEWSGLSADVVYDYDDYVWRVRASAQRAKAFAQILARWWEEYQGSHPNGPGATCVSNEHVSVHPRQ